MNLFTSHYEKRYWIGSLAISITILSTLFIGQPLLEIFDNQNLRAAIFLFVMLLIATALIIHAVIKNEHLVVNASLIGVFAVYSMFILRLGMPERTHLMEYTVLTIFIHKALIERFHIENKVLKPAILTFVIAAIIGIIDELLQIFIPERVFDLEDIIFNCIAALMAVITFLTVRRIKHILHLKTKN